MGPSWRCSPQTAEDRLAGVGTHALVRVARLRRRVDRGDLRARHERGDDDDDGHDRADLLLAQVEPERDAERDERGHEADNGRRLAAGALLDGSHDYSLMLVYETMPSWVGSISTLTVLHDREH